MSATQSELRLARLIDERETTQKLHEDLLASAETRDDKSLGDAERVQVKAYRERVLGLDDEIKELAETIERHNTAVENSKAIRRVLAGGQPGVEASEDGVAYRTMAAYARDYIITRESRVCSQIASQFANPQEIQVARERLQLAKRAPDNTLSSNVDGLIPDQHIAEIFQVIDSSRPIVASARRSSLVRGTLTYPQVDTSPTVAVQASEKTEGGTDRLAVSMQTATASTYIGGGDLSWQAINWSTPDALALWFQLAGADYALKTEQDAAQVVQHSGFSFNIATTLAALTDFSDVLLALASGAGDVYANSGRMADTVYLAPDAFYAVAAIAGTEAANFVAAGQVSLRTQGGSLAGLNVVVSRGMDSGVIVVGDSAGLLVAETAGAPVELRVVEPAIGGVEVGIIGAFEAVVVDPGAFAMITTAS
jgi:HK97 family phage major capsid protein